MINSSNLIALSKLAIEIDDGGGGGGGSLPRPIKNPVLPDLLNLRGGVGFFQLFIPRFITIAFIIGSIFFVVVMIVGAIQWITSGGDKSGVEAARGKIVNAVIGVVLLFAVYAIIRLVQDFFGITILTLDIDSLIIK